VWDWDNYFSKEELLEKLRQINDDFGHLEGDRVLKVSAELVKENIRATDVAAR
jgi:diguanylate cyclase (GGDEF)-like protein